MNRYISIILIMLIPFGVAAQEVYTDNVVIVLDGSGSMEASMGNVNRLTAAKSAIRTVVSQLPGTTHVGLIVFNSSGQEWLYELGKVDQTRIRQAIVKAKLGGGTPLGEYMKKGADRLLQAREKQHGYGSYRLLIVTDGEASDKRRMNRYAEDIVTRGIVLDVIGVGMDSDHSLKKKAHSYRNAANQASLTQAVAEIFAEVSADQVDAGGESDYDVIAPLPDALASELIKAFSRSGNHPIGEKPKQAVNSSRPVSQDAGSQSGAAEEESPILLYGLLGIFIALVVIGVVSIRLRSSH